MTFFMRWQALRLWILEERSQEKLPKRKSVTYKKRVDRKYLNGRTYKDYKEYIKDNPDVFVTQMDTVYNDASSGPFLQTFKFINSGVLFAIYHEQKKRFIHEAGN